MSKSKQILEDFRQGVNAKCFSLASMTRATGVSKTTLFDMMQPGWGNNFFKTEEALAKLEKAMKKAKKKGA